MKVNVYHAQRNHITGDVESQEHVAVVNMPSSITEKDEALEYAFRWTQNIMGSWSRNDIEDNSDHNPLFVERVAPLHESGMGLRSSMMGDQFVIENELGDRSLHEVAMMGFKDLVA
tara:strand:- start:164 stop:511 length:348 start_codon:yes stop_codon:yes gene_type:complete